MRLYTNILTLLFSQGLAKNLDPAEAFEEAANAYSNRFLRTNHKHQFFQKKDAVIHLPSDQRGEVVAVHNADIGFSYTVKLKTGSCVSAYANELNSDMDNKSPSGGSGSSSWDWEQTA